MSIHRLTLRTLLLLDAVTCAAMGALLVLAGGPAARLTGLSPSLLFWAGFGLLPIAAFMAFAARLLGARPDAGLAAARAVIAGNVLWVVASLLLLVPGMAAPNGFGVAFVLAQGVAVALLAVLEHRAAAAELGPTVTGSAR